jgi:hypothetical protein
MKKADVIYKRKWERSPAFRLQHSTPKMWHLKLLAALMICLLLLGQVRKKTCTLDVIVAVEL